MVQATERSPSHSTENLKPFRPNELDINILIYRRLQPTQEDELTRVVRVFDALDASVIDPEIAKVFHSAQQGASGNGRQRVKLGKSSERIANTPLFYLFLDNQQEPGERMLLTYDPHTKAVYKGMDDSSPLTAFELVKLLENTGNKSKDIVQALKRFKVNLEPVTPTGNPYRASLLTEALKKAEESLEKRVLDGYDAKLLRRFVSNSYTVAVKQALRHIEQEARHIAKTDLTTALNKKERSDLLSQLLDKEVGSFIDRASALASESGMNLQPIEDEKNRIIDQLS